MPWSIDGPSSRQLGYRRREKGRLDDPLPREPRPLWRWLGLGLLVVVAVLLAVLLVLRLTASPPRIAAEAPGTWREVGTAEQYALTVERTGTDDFTVVYARVGGTQRATLKGDALVVVPRRSGSEKGCALAYDPESGQLIATTSDGTYKLERVS
jgi:hypothetical protein